MKTRPLRGTLVLGCILVTGALLSSSPAQAQETEYRGGTYNVQGSARILSSGAKRPISGKVIVEQTGNVVHSTFHMRSVARTPVGMRRVEFIGRGEGTLDGLKVQGTADVRILLAHLEGEESSEPPQELLRLENEYHGHFDENGIFHISLEYEPVEGGPPEASTTTLVGRRVDTGLTLGPKDDAYPQRFLSLAENEAGRIRQLTQRGVREFMQSAMGASGSRWEEVSATTNEFDSALGRVEALLQRAPVEERKQFQAQLDVIRERWIPVRSTLERPPVSAGPIRAGNLVDQQTLVTLNQSAEEVNAATNKLLNMLAGTCDPTLSLRCHISVDISGRQRMLTERILKNLVIMSGEIGDRDALRVEIQKDREEFGENLATIREGLEFLKEAISDEAEVVALDVESIAKRWASFEQQVDTVLEGRRTSRGLPARLLVSQSNLANALDKFTTQIALANF